MHLFASVEACRFGVWIGCVLWSGALEISVCWSLDCSNGILVDRHLGITDDGSIHWDLVDGLGCATEYNREAGNLYFLTGLNRKPRCVGPLLLVTAVCVLLPPPPLLFTVVEWN